MTTTDRTTGLRIKERLTDGDVIEVEVIREPLDFWVHSTYASVMKWSLGSLPVDEFFSARGPSSSAEVRGLVIHDIKEVQGVRQQEEQEDKRDEEEGNEVNGEVEEITLRAAHET